MGLATREGSDTPVSNGDKPTSGGSAYSKPLGQATLIPPLKSGLISGPFGDVYKIRRSKTIPADAVQARSRWMDFYIKGYVDNGNTTAGTPTGYLDGQTLLADWYGYARQMGKAALKYKHTPTTLHSNARLEDYLNVAFYAIQNLSLMFNLDRLYMFNQAFSTLYTYLPDRIGRAKRLWRRLSTIFLPAALKAYAMKKAMIPMVEGVWPAHLSLYREVPLVMYGGASDYTDLYTAVGGSFSHLLSDATHMTTWLDNIEIAVWALEGNISDANTQEDVIAIKDAIDMLNDVVPGLFTQGLPDPAEFPGLMNDPTLLNDWYHRCILGHTTTNTAFNAFPVVGYTPLDDNIPVVGWGVPGMEEDTLLGFPKMVLLDSTAGAIYADAAQEYLIFGTDLPANPWDQLEELYTREDGWVTVQSGGIDLNDGTAIRTLINGGHSIIHHDFFPILFAKHLGAGLELRFLDHLPVNYQMYIPSENFGPHYAMMLGQWLGVPYIK